MQHRPRSHLKAPCPLVKSRALLASPLGRAFNGSTVTLDGARDNFAGAWPPPGLADASGEVPTEERREPSVTLENRVEEGGAASEGADNIG